MNRAATGLLMAIAVALPGCGRGDAPVSSSPAKDDLQAYGIRYDLPIAGEGMDRSNEFLRAVKPDGVSWTGGGHTLEVSAGKVTLDGKPCGVVNPGDRIRLTSDGSLFVNDERRRPGA